MAHKLFEPSFGWEASALPSPYETKRVEGIKSKYGTGTYCTIHAGTAFALLRYMELESGGPLTNHAAIGMTGTNYVAEYEHSDGTIDIAEFNPDNRKFKMSRTMGTGKFDPVSITKSASIRLEVMFLCLMPELLKDEEAQEALEELKKATDNEQKRNLMGLFCDNVYRRVLVNTFKVNLPVDGNVSHISATLLKTPAMAATAMMGDFKIFTGGGSGKAKAKSTKPLMDIEALREKYACNEKWTDAEKMLIAPKPDYIISEEIIDILDYYIGLEGEKEPQRNFMWRGETGFGKTTGIDILSYILNRPRLRMNCHPMMETNDFLVQFVPMTDKETKEAKITELYSTDYPVKLSFDEISFDPESAYTMLTGETKEGISPNEVYDEYIIRLETFKRKEEEKRFSEEVEAFNAKSKLFANKAADGDYAGAYTAITGESKEGIGFEEAYGAYQKFVIMCSPMNPEKKRKESSDTPRFKLVESEYIKALAKGYIIEIMEPSMILNPGVLAGLNGYNKPGAVIPLVDGSYTYRHKDAMVIFTDNVSYEGCKALNQSVIRRNFMIIDSYNMDKTAVLERVKNNTGFDDDETLEKMYDIWKGIRDYCQSHAITDGCTSIEELTNWAKAVLIQLQNYGEMNLQKTCRHTVISKATAMVDEQEAIIAAKLALAGI